MIFHILLLIAFWVVANHFRNKIKNLPPTPFPTLPIIGHLYLLKQPLYRTLSKISARYGPILLLKFGSRRVLLVSFPSAAEECLTKNDITFANRPNLLVGKHLGYNYTSLLWASYGDHWRNLRKISSLEPERFEGFEGVRDGSKLMPFGAGRRSCPGEGLALRMVGLALGTLIQCFDWEKPDKGMVDMTEGPGLSLPKAHSLQAKCRPRPSMLKLLS